MVKQRLPDLGRKSVRPPNIDKVDLRHKSFDGVDSAEFNVADSNTMSASAKISSSLLFKNNPRGLSTPSLNSSNDIVGLLHVYGGRNSD